MPKNFENFLPVHPSMVELYESMVGGNESTIDVIKILAVAGRVKSENPCIVKFKMPRKSRYSDVFKINLHLKTLETDFKGDLDQDIVEVAILEDSHDKKIIALKIINAPQSFKLDLAPYIDTRSNDQQVEVWIGSRPGTSEIDCSKVSIERPTLLVHFKGEKKNKLLPILPTAVNKREVLEDTSYPRLPHTCQRSDFFIHFGDLGWTNWILSPGGYEAGRCVGHCNSPLSQQTEPTNYARIMSVLREVGHKDAVGPHCVPGSLHPLPLLLYDHQGNVLLKLYEDMVVQDCSCK